MKGNINKMVDMYENTELIGDVLKSYWFDKKMNICSEYIHPFKNKSYCKACGFEDVFFIGKPVYFNDIKNFLSFAKIKNHTDWRLPTPDEVKTFMEKVDSYLDYMTNEETDEEHFTTVSKVDKRGMYYGYWHIDFKKSDNNDKRTGWSYVFLVR